MPQHQGSSTHVWIAAAEVQIDPRLIKRALLRQSIRATEGQVIDILDIYCAGCRRAYVDVADQPCICATTTMHLHGGPEGTRKKRSPMPVPTCALPALDVPGLDVPGLDRAAVGP